jgi:plastocyanin
MPFRSACRRRRLSHRLGYGRAGLACAVLLGAAGIGACAGDDAGPGVEAASGVDADWAFTIPAGAGERIDAGEALAILPAEMDVRVGQVIRIVNEDDRGHLVGPFFVGAGETLVQRFSSPGEFVGECTVHPSGRLVLRVSP